MTPVETWHLDLAAIGLLLGAAAALSVRRAVLGPAPAVAIAGAVAVAVADVPAPAPALALGALLAIAATVRPVPAALAWVGAGALVVASSPSGAWVRPTAAIVLVGVAVATLRPGLPTGRPTTGRDGSSTVPTLALVVALVASWTHVPDTEGIVALGAAVAVVLLAGRGAGAPSVVPVTALLLVQVVAHDSRGRPAAALALLATMALVAGAIVVAQRSPPPPATAVLLPGTLTVVAARTVGVADDPRPGAAALLALAVAVSWWVVTARGPRAPADRAGPGTS